MIIPARTRSLSRIRLSRDRDHCRKVKWAINTIEVGLTPAAPHPPTPLVNRRTDRAHKRKQQLVETPGSWTARGYLFLSFVSDMCRSTTGGLLSGSCLD
jgi:hypothetical protein